MIFLFMLQSFITETSRDYFTFTCLDALRVISFSLYIFHYLYVKAFSCSLLVMKKIIPNFYLVKRNSYYFPISEIVIDFNCIYKVMTVFVMHNNEKTTLLYMEMHFNPFYYIDWKTMKYTIVEHLNLTK